MAKSTRSKGKRAFRAKKRTEGVYAATEAARLQRLNAKLHTLTTPTAEEEEVVVVGAQAEENEQELDVDIPVEDADAEMAASPTTEGVDGKPSENSTGKKKISTHGPRGSRREQWRASKGMTPRPKSRGTNRQGTLASRYKPGRSHRRR
ncbi:hypothetical protein BC827DRAFT_1193896 [Russula dissimulans]|nr:hypothetical protein BC827DRAFT_1193896 [Russula dissimulans]